MGRLRGIMSDPDSQPITELLAAIGRGDASAQERLWTLIYEELRNLARQQMADEATGRTLQPTALVHEAFIRLLGMEKTIDWANRKQFFKTAAQVMRHIRIDDARRRKRLKRGGGQKASLLEDAVAVLDQDPNEVLAVHDALDRLEQLDQRKAEVVMLRYFAGLTVDETARALSLAPRTVDSDWRFARLWLHGELSNGEHPPEETHR